MGTSEPQVQALRAGRFPSQKNAGKLQCKKTLQVVMAVPTEGGRCVEVGMSIGRAAARVYWHLGAGHVVGRPLATQPPWKESTRGSG